MKKENIDLEHQLIQIIEVGTKTLQEKSYPLKEQYDHIDVDILDRQIDANIPNEHSDVDIQGEKQHVFDETYFTKVLEDRKELEVVIVDEPCDEKVDNDGKEVDVLVLDGTKRWHLRLRKKVVWPIKRIIVAARKKTCDEAMRIDKDQIVMNLSPSMEILQHKDILTKNLVFLH